MDSHCTRLAERAPNNLLQQERSRAQKPVQIHLETSFPSSSYFKPNGRQ